MFSQLKKKVCNVGGEGFWAVPVKDGNRWASMDNGIPKVNLRRGEVENGGDAEGNEAKGLEVREGSPLKVMISADEERGGSKPCVKSRKGPIVWTVH